MSIGKAIKGTNQTDKVMTNIEVVSNCLQLIELKDTDIILEPCKGTGNFYNELIKINNNVKWCEIDEGIDFLDFKDKIDWIITNPPYSIYEEFLDHCFEVADNIALLIPLAKPFSSLGRIKKIQKYGGIHIIWVFPYTASKAGFPFGFPLSLTYFKKGYTGEQKIIFLNKEN